MNMTKCGLSLLVMMGLNSCIIPETVVSIGKAVDIVDITSPSSSAPTSIEISQEKKRKRQSENRDPINSKYSNRDLASCFIGAIFLGPLNAVSELLSFKTDVDINLSKEVIELVKTDLNKYIEENSKISPDDFWRVISLETAEKLNLELIKAYDEVSNESFIRKKKMIAYAFLYYLESGDVDASYKFSFDDREGDLGILREAISFNGSNKLKDAKDVGICGYFRFSDISIETTHLSDKGIISKIICAGRKGMGAFLTKKDSGETVIEIRTGISNFVTMNNNGLDIDIDEKEIEIDYKNSGYPKVYIDLKKRNVKDEDGEKSYLKNSVKEMDVKIDYRRFSIAKRYNNLKCREIKAFDFE